MLNNLLITLLSFDPFNFVLNLKYMVIGMVCIIIVMGVLIGITTLLNKIASRDSKKDNNK